MKSYTVFTHKTMAKQVIVQKVFDSVAPIILCVIFPKWYFILTVAMYLLYRIVSDAVVSGYSFSIYRSFILVKINEKGISNLFCKITWEEINTIHGEVVDITSKASNWAFKQLAKNYGTVILISKGKNDKEQSFKKYSLFKTICLELNEKNRAYVSRCCPLENVKEQIRKID